MSATLEWGFRCPNSWLCVPFLFVKEIITEAQNPAGEMFGKEAISRIIRENADVEASALLDAIIDALDHFRDGFNLQDDVTLIVVKIGKA